MTKAERDKNIKLAESAIRQIFLTGGEIDLERFISQIMYSSLSSRRTSLEYINAALSQFNTEEFLRNKRVIIIEKLYNDQSKLS